MKQRGRLLADGTGPPAAEPRAAPASVCMVPPGARRRGLRALLLETMHPTVTEPPGCVRELVS